MKQLKWIKVEKSEVNDYVREQRYIVTTIDPSPINADAVKGSKLIEYLPQL